MTEFTNILLNEQEYEKVMDPKKPLYIYDWLSGIQPKLESLQPEDLTNLVEPFCHQILDQIKGRPGPSVRKLLSLSICCLLSKAPLTASYSMVDNLFDILRTDESQFSTNARLSTIFCLGNLFRILGRSLGNSVDTAIAIFSKILKNSDSQVRCEIMDAFSNIVIGFSNQQPNIVKEIWKAAKNTITDRSQHPKNSAIKCMHQLIVNSCVANANDLEQTANLCLRSFEASSAEVRQESAKLLASGSSDVIKGSHSANREIRLGITYTFVQFFIRLGSDWFQANFNLAVGNVLCLLQPTSKFGVSSSSHSETVFARHCVRYILLTTARKMLSEDAQIQLANCLLADVKSRLSVTTFMPEYQTLATARTLTESVPETDKVDAVIAKGFPASTGPQEDQHYVTAALETLRQLVVWLDSLAVMLVEAPGHLLDCLFRGLAHSTMAVRLASAACLKQLAVSMPLDRLTFIDRCINLLQIHRSDADAIHGFSMALAALVTGSNYSSYELPILKYKEVRF
ncbi:HEAT repeat containing 5A [Cichlidogyrus casuarinus]|uniref:HEAT repeat containing 5A n=1 Tax=Cichlidogyrus casuarinus TaxID=1844966 RepID=A0ABD2QAU2_9PLAT